MDLVGDEINLVEPGFNGGWSKIQGFWTVSETGEKMKMVTGEPSGLVNFGGKGKYHEPKLVWDKTIAPTALTFLNSTKARLPICERFVYWLRGRRQDISFQIE